jgi:hypothetical protein
VAFVADFRASSLHVWCTAALFVEITKVKDLLINPEERGKFDRQRTARLQKAEKFKQLDEQHQRMRTGMLAAIVF